VLMDLRHFGKNGRINEGCRLELELLDQCGALGQTIVLHDRGQVVDAVLRELGIDRSSVGLFPLQSNQSQEIQGLLERLAERCVMA
jgi:hypothetical protein